MDAIGTHLGGNHARLNQPFGELDDFVAYGENRDLRKKGHPSGRSLGVSARGFVEYGLRRASSRFPEFFSNDSTDRVSIDTVSGLSEMFAKRLIDHRLVAPTFGVRALSKCLEHVVVEVDRDPGLSPLTNHWPAPAFAEVVFLFHIGVFRSNSPAALRSDAHPRHDRCTRRRRF